MSFKHLLSDRLLSADSYEPSQVDAILKHAIAKMGTQMPVPHFIEIKAEQTLFTIWQVETSRIVLCNATATNDKDLAPLTISALDNVLHSIRMTGIRYDILLIPTYDRVTQHYALGTIMPNEKNATWFDSALPDDLRDQLTNPDLRKMVPTRLLNRSEVYSIYDIVSKYFPEFVCLYQYLGHLNRSSDRKETSSIWSTEYALQIMCGNPPQSIQMNTDQIRANHAMILDPTIRDFTPEHKEDALFDSTGRPHPKSSALIDNMLVTLFYAKNSKSILHFLKLFLQIDTKKFRNTFRFSSNTNEISIVELANEPQRLRSAQIQRQRTAAKAMLHLHMFGKGSSSAAPKLHHAPDKSISTSRGPRHAAMPSKAPTKRQSKPFR